ncbi:MAG TPA: XTP/dITP diphosphatase [Dehalococcoidia bacterium]|nr:XTP/dITP diphosphatase [Dehalococcoidia bacterium]
MTQGRRLLLATDNRAKAREYRMLLKGIPYRLVTPAQLGVKVSVAEGGSTLEENAISKAMAYARASGVLALADDSGLEVDALGGEPGVRSARYAGPEASDRELVRHLLDKLKGVPWERRQARFRCVIALAWPEGRVKLFKGECPGMIAFEPKGRFGFGYDPIFYLPELGKTMAELEPGRKNEISHRGRAARAARPFLETMDKSA